MERYTPEYDRAKAEITRIAILYYIAYRGMKNTLVNTARPKETSDFIQLIGDILEGCDFSIKYADGEKTKNETSCKEVCDNGTK